MRVVLSAVYLVFVVDGLLSAAMPQKWLATQHRFVRLGWFRRMIDKLLELPEPALSAIGAAQSAVAGLLFWRTWAKR